MSKVRMKEKIQTSGGFRHWFVNSFWFHYKWVVLAVALLVGVVGFLVVDALRSARYDATVVIATTYAVTDEMLAPLDEVLSQAIGDLDGNGRVSICYDTVSLGDGQLGEENEEQMYLYMTQSEIALYLMDRTVSDAFTNPDLGYFEDDLSKFGIQGDPDNPVRLALGDNKLLTSCGLHDLYLSIMDYTTSKQEKDVAEAVDAGVKMAQAIIAAG